MFVSDLCIKQGEASDRGLVFKIVPAVYKVKPHFREFYCSIKGHPLTKMQ